MVTPDSGASQIAFPASAFTRLGQSYGKQVECQKGWEFEQGDMTFVIGGKPYSVASNHWNRREIIKGTEGERGKCKMSV